MIKNINGWGILAIECNILHNCWINNGIYFFNSVSTFDYLDFPTEWLKNFDKPALYSINVEKIAFLSIENICNSVR